MYRVEACVGCGSTALRRLPAVVAPFIETYVLNRRRPGPVSLCVCEACELAFYDHRLTDAEIARLYAGYRGEGYLRARRRVEPFYTARINEAIGADEATIRLRRSTVGDFLTAATAHRAPSSILDYGGDAGQFIPDLAGARKYVHEISDVEPAEGVERHDGQPVDLVMLAHVLEHASDPGSMLSDLGDLVTPDGWLYVEVPLDRPQMPPERWLRLHTRWVGVVSRGLRRTVAADLMSTPLRVLLRDRWVPFTFPKVHEHLNHWCEESLPAALRAADWEPAASMTYVLGSGPLRMPALGMVARRR